MHATGPTPLPRVSVGMPTYNAAGTIAESIRSLLDQSLGDLELIVSDNASTDGTWAIVEDIARRDPRVVAFRQAQNIGANGNYSAVFRCARAPYFKWASSNDWCAPDFLARCVERLVANPGTVLVAPRTRLFSGSVDNFTEYPRDVAFDQPRPAQRFEAVGRSLPLNNILNGVMRSDALARTRLIEHYIGADVVLIGHLALLGKIELVDEPMFYRRMDPETATQMMSEEAVIRHHYPARTRRALFPAWRKASGLLRTVFSSGLPPDEMFGALSWALRTTYWAAPAMGRDLIDAVAYATHR